MFKMILEKLSDRQHLTRQESAGALEMMIRDEISAAEIGGFLIGLRFKGETVDEILGFVDTMENYMVKIKLKDKNAMDVCGTGGDGTHSFNVSTTSALVVAAGGVTIAKHGNRSVSSKTGSADVLKELGVKIDPQPEQVKSCIDEIGIGFLFAPIYHPAMKKVAPYRKSLRLYTVFNMLGPLLNPAGVKRQLIGTYNYDTARKLAGVLKLRSYEKACTVHSSDGFDEFSPFAENHIFEVTAAQDQIKEYRYKYPKKIHGRHSINGSDACENAKITLGILAGEEGPCREMTVINAAFAFYVAGKTGSVSEGIKLAESMIDGGLAKKKLLELVDYSNSFFV